MSHTHTHDHEEEFHSDIVYPDAIPFVLVHLAAFGVIWTGFSVETVLLCVGLYVVRMFAITAGYHRYFSHRSFKTSRVFQFILAFVAQSSAQQGALWWAAIHRHHHKHSDTLHDIHSPRHHGFLFSHVGWIFDRERRDADYSNVQDLTRYPELVFLEKYDKIPPLVLAVACYLLAGWQGLFVGFFLSTVLTYHGTFFINSLAHVFGKQRYVTADDSRNNWFLALITLGEGWHNNHHFYQSSTRQGFRWWEIDLTYYVLKALSWVGVVWDLREPPKEVVTGERGPGRRALERVAAELAHSFPIERLARQALESLPQTPTLEEVGLKAREAREAVQDRLANVHLPQLPQLPTVEEIRAKAAERFAESPSLDEVAERARELLLEAVSARILDDLAPEPA